MIIFISSTVIYHPFILLFAILLTLNKITLDEKPIFVQFIKMLQIKKYFYSVDGLWKVKYRCQVEPVLHLWLFQFFTNMFKLLDMLLLLLL